MYLAVRSFARKEAFLFRQWYGRVANRPYDAAAEHDHHAHFTVSCYDPDEATRSQQVLLLRREATMCLTCMDNVHGGRATATCMKLLLMPRLSSSNQPVLK